MISTAENRKSGMGDAEQAALHKSMVAYSGKYRIEGNDFITLVDVAWNEVWDGTEQRRHFRLDGDRLFIESAAGPSIIFPGSGRPPLGMTMLFDPLGLIRRSPALTPGSA